MNPDLVDDHIDDELDTDFSAPARSRVSVRTRPLGARVYLGRSPRARRVYRRRRFKAAIGLVLAVVVIWTGVSLGGALTNPAFGSSLSARFAEWARQHGGAGIVNWVENEWYCHHPPPRRQASRLAPCVRLRHAGGLVATAGPAHLPPPAPIAPFASPPISGEGQWSPVGRLVGGVPAVYETTLRPDAVHTS